MALKRKRDKTLKLIGFFAPPLPPVGTTYRLHLHFPNIKRQGGEPLENTYGTTIIHVVDLPRSPILGGEGVKG